MEILYVTGNKKKVEAAKNILEKENIIIKQVDLNLEEIQGNILDIAIKKAMDAYENLQSPLIINDSNLEIDALNGFPGPYTKYVEETLKDDGILKLLSGESNRRASYTDILVYIDKYGYHAFSSSITGNISKESLAGDYYPYDKLFIKEGLEYPIAYYGNLEIDKLYENDTYLKLLNFLKKRKVARGITFIDNKVLLLHRIRKENDQILDYYAIPGGGVEDMESIEDACLREVLEETSLNVSINSFLEHEEYENGVCYYFLTNYLGGTPVLGGEEKENNNPDNSYEISLIDIHEIDNINMYGIGINMIKKAYEIHKNLKG